MIIYATKLTFDRYRPLKLPGDLAPPANILVNAVIAKEKGDRLLEWGAKLFYFDKRKCIQIMNFASKFTLFLFDVKVADLENATNFIPQYIFELYKDDEEMIRASKKMFASSPLACFDKLTDKSAIATLNTAQTRFAYDGYRFYKFIRDGILHTLEINHQINFEYPVTMKIDGKTDYIYGGKLFRQLVVERYL